MDLHSKHKDTRDILTSSAWDALIHHPVVEEEEDTEELPSTVDMDAIKGAPSTPLTGPATPWSVSDGGNNGKRLDSNESSSDDEDEGDSDGSSSGSESDESESDSSSSSSSRSSSCSSRSDPSGISSPARQTFAVSKPDFDQGGLKLKISALKISSNSKSGNGGTESDSCSSASQEKLKITAEKSKRVSRSTTKVAFTEESNDKKTEHQLSAADNISKEKSKLLKPASNVSNKKSKTIVDKKQNDVKTCNVTKKTTDCAKINKSESFPDVGSKSSTTALKSESKKNDATLKKENVSTSPHKPVSPKKKSTEVSKLRSVRKKPTPRSSTTQKSVAGSSNLRYGRNAISLASCQSTSRSQSTSPDSSESEECEETRVTEATISELAQQLGDIGPTGALPTMTEHLQVINQEDLAAILPDVVTTEANATFDGFEDVSSESGKDKKDVVQDSGSDVELPDQIVSDAIKRIHVDSEDVDNSDSDKEPATKHAPQKTTNHKDSDSESSSSEDGADYSPMYSSSLLQQFVERTEILSAQCERSTTQKSTKKVVSSSKDSNAKNSKGPKPIRSVDVQPPVVRAMPELEPYPLDCSQSNVSPDSGIQSVPGSPVNDGPRDNRDSTPPVLRPISPPEKGLKKRPGRPKKFRNGRIKASHIRKAETLCKVEDRPTVHCLNSAKRGPGRPKKVAPVLEPSIPLTSKEESDSSNLNMMINEIYERVNRRLDPSTKAIEIKELERIISDHKSSKARNSKIDAIFSKSKKLSKLPNIAIVKPMQHHILNEKKDDDEKQNKRGVRRSKIDDVIALKTDPKEENFDDIKKEFRERRKSERDKKACVKPFMPTRNQIRPNRSKLTQLPSTADAGCDQIEESDSKKPDIIKPMKSDFIKKEGKRKIKNVGKVSGSKSSTAINYVQPMPRKCNIKKRPKFLSVRPCLSNHKHKKKKTKTKKHKKSEKEKIDRAWFMKELEFVINNLQKFSIDVKKNLPTAPVAPTLVVPVEQPVVEMVVPQETRVKRIGKKRKGSERSRGSDRESGAEKSKLSDRESSTEDPGKDKEKEKIEKEKPKRKQKKSNNVEIDKGKAETNPNEQRLPLKKRHYHLTSSNQTPEVVSDGKENDVKKEPERVKDTIATRRDSEKPTGKEASTQIKKDVDRLPSKDAAVVVKKDDRTKCAESQRVLRSSVDEVIEATITRFSSVTSTDATSQSLETGQCTVIVTPKKRYKAEEETVNGSKVTVSKLNMPMPTVKSSVSKIGTSRSISSPAVDKGGGKAISTSGSREGVIKSVGNADPKRRSGSRSSSLTSKDSKADKPSLELGKVEKLKKTLSKSEAKVTPKKGKVKMQTRSAAKPFESNDSKTQPLHIDLPLLTVETIKVEALNSDSLQMDTLTPATESKDEVKVVKQPMAGIFEPSEEAVAIDSSILVPLNSPSEIGNTLKGSLSVKKLKIPTANKDGEKDPVLNPKSVAISKNKKNKLKTIQKIKAVSVILSKLTGTEVLLQKADKMKKKARRRKYINRTGFPSKKKKKKVFAISENKTVGPVISTVTNKNDLTPNKPTEDQADTSNTTHHMNQSLIPDGPVLSDTKDDVLTNENEPASKIEETPVKAVKKVSSRIEEKLNAGRVSKKRNVKTSSLINPKRAKVDRAAKTVKTEAEEKKPAPLPENVVEDVQPTPAPIRKRKRSSTIKNTKSKMKSRYQLPLLSMKKFKKTKKEEKAPSEDESTTDAAEAKKKPTKPQPRWRKKYLTAGLFSDYYKETSDKPPSKQTEKSLNKFVFNPSEHEHGLLPPPAYCTKFVLHQRVDFLLPYDLWWLHANNQLPGRDIVPSWNYRKIRTNVYYDVKPQTTGTNEVQSCNCKTPTGKQKGCGEDCINRMVFCECSPQLCPCKEKCSNQRIQRHEYAPGLDRFMTKEKGWGVRSTQTIKAGEFILEYVGEVVSEKEFKERMQSRYVNDTHHYCLHLDGGLVIDGHRMGGDGRFVNHSCEPNCEMQKWTVNGLFRMALFALKNISANQELTYDYNFSLFNPVEGQVCLCGAKSCRGVIGGKSQRVTVQGGTVQALQPNSRDKKTGRGRKNNQARRRNDKGKTQLETTAVKAISKPMSHQQRCFAQIHHCFLLRNVEKIKRGRGAGKATQKPQLETKVACNEVKPADVFYTQLNALSTLRSIKTRRLAQAEDNPELAKVAKLAHVLKDLYSAIVTAKDEKGECLATPFTTLPAKKKQPQYYKRVTDPIDLATVEQNINSGKYNTIEAFDMEVKRLFANNIRFYGRTSELGIAATRIKRAYNLAKMDVVPQLEDILGENLPATFLPEKTDPGAEEEDVIRCVCGLYKDEGVMIQCERCLVWQHCDCVKADDSCEHYLCERCEPRDVNYEILMEPSPEYAQEGQTHYISLMRGTLQLRVSDTVYVLRDMLEESVSGNSPPRKVTYKTIKNVNYADLDIFRIERLWIDEKGAKFAFGHHYLRPHETYHEPSRKFFTNEVMRVPLYEVVPLDLIMQHCWVLDLNTFCKGRPVGAPEEHIYICEYRVDKSAHLFAKIAKPHPICTKNYAFEKFDTRLRPMRTYTPHGEAPVRGCVRSNTRSTNGEEGRRADSEEELPLARVRDHAHAAKRDMQRKRLNKILLNLLSRLPKQQPLDVSYLLEPVKRARSKSIVKKAPA